MFHVNPTNGDVGQCRATNPDRCPFGGLEKHFDTADQAREAFEKTMESPAALKKSKLPTTAYARELGERLRKRGRLTEEERKKRFQLVDNLTMFEVRIEDGVPGAFTEAYDYTRKIYLDEVDHENNGNLLSWGGEIYEYNRSTDFLRQLSQLHTDHAKLSPEDRERQVKRIDDGATQLKSQYFVAWERFGRTSFPIEELNYFAKREKYYMPSVIEALDKGWTQDLMSKTHSRIWTDCTPEGARKFAEKYPLRLMSELGKLGTRGATRFTDDVAMELADAGFTSEKEVKDYARKFGISWTESTFFQRVAKAKRKYPNLADYTPEI